MAIKSRQNHNHNMRAGRASIFFPLWNCVYLHNSKPNAWGFINLYILKIISINWNAVQNSLAIFTIFLF